MVCLVFLLVYSLSLLTMFAENGCLSFYTTCRLKHTVYVRKTTTISQMVLKAAVLILEGFAIGAFDKQHNVILVRCKNLIWIKAGLGVMSFNFIYKIDIARVHKGKIFTVQLILYMHVNVS